MEDRVFTKRDCDFTSFLETYSQITLRIHSLHLRLNTIDLIHLVCGNNISTISQSIRSLLILHCNLENMIRDN